MPPRPHARRWRTSALIAAALFLSAPALASAQEGEGELVQPGAEGEEESSGSSDADEKEAIRLFKMGQLHFEGNEFAEAAETFLEAFALDPNPVLAFNVARAYENDGELQDARVWYDKALSLDPPEEVVKRAQSALVRLDKAQDAIAEGVKEEVEAAAPTTGALTVTSNVPAAVRINGELVGETPHEATLAPDNYTIELTRDGHFPYTQTVELSRGDKVQVSAALEEEPFPVGWIGWTGIGLAAAGASGFVAGSFFEEDARADFDEADSLSARRQPGRFEELRASGEEARDNAEIAYIGGASAMTLGVVMFLTDLTLNLTAEPDYEAGATVQVGLDRVVVTLGF